MAENYYKDLFVKQYSCYPRNIYSTMQIDDLIAKFDHTVSYAIAYKYLFGEGSVNAAIYIETPLKIPLSVNCAVVVNAELHAKVICDRVYINFMYKKDIYKIQYENADMKFIETEKIYFDGNTLIPYENAKIVGVNFAVTQEQILQYFPGLLVISCTENFIGKHPALIRISDFYTDGNIRDIFLYKNSPLIDIYDDFIDTYFDFAGCKNNVNKYRLKLGIDENPLTINEFLNTLYAPLYKNANKC
jgi:hypothetical protein